MMDTEPMQIQMRAMILINQASGGSSGGKIMGDMADYDIEQGLDMWAAHCGKCCLQDCIYCEENANGS
ncbi:hypothetical protein LCGC14_2422560 [marine sediment metagenome]|uniref:Uncharacterized protein n=1 Tax=marine sediment metagenome TaxID=412755 RepID=A0A0F9BPC1_9ZZZZ